MQVNIYMYLIVPQNDSTDAQPVIRETASIIFTNFDMIHASILPHENNWRTLVLFFCCFALCQYFVLQVPQESENSGRGRAALLF